MKVKILFSIIILIFFHLITFAQKNIPPDWLTHFEKSNYTETPRYKETMEYFKKFEKNSPYAKMISFGKSGEDRALNVLIVSKDKAFMPEVAAQTGKVILMIQNGIHAGEIDGKEATMILLREILITKEKFHYLDNVILLVIPIFNVDGHERFGPYNRINQNGPKEMGWRVNATNLNLNRDYMKADSPEMKCWLKLFNDWLPDMFVDCHVTDGADYQYTITYSIEKNQNTHSFIGDWVRSSLTPFFESEVEQSGYLIAPYVWFRAEEVSKGIVDGVTGPRLSTGYVAIQNRIALLIETHMLKDYKSRVFATHSMLDAVIRKLNSESKKIKEIIKKADEESIWDFTIRAKSLPLKFQVTDESIPFNFKGIRYRKEMSEISGKEKITYTGEKFELEIPLFNKVKVTDSVSAPYAYIIPKQWKEVIDILKLHGIKVHRTSKQIEVIVERYKFNEDASWWRKPYEGRLPLTASYTSFNEKVKLPEGSYLVFLNQRTIRVIVHLLEPKGPDALVNLGFFNSIFEHKEYFEDYVMEKIALQMIKENPNLKVEFEKKLATDSTFAKDPLKRLDYFYRQSPYFDTQWNVYPVMRLNEKVRIDCFAE